MTESLETRRLVEAVSRGDEAAGALLVDRLLPVMMARVRRARARTPELRVLEERDFVQEIWVVLLAQGARVLRAWDPERGASFEGYVGMISDREMGNAGQRLRARKRARTDVSLEVVPLAVPSSESSVMARDAIYRLADHLARNLPPKALLIFRYLYTEGRTPEEVAALMGINRQVVYNWQHRIRRSARDFAREPERPSPSAP